MIEALDAVRETGAGRQDTLQLDDRRWTVWFERLGAEQVGVYGLRDGNVNHELLHALCNPIHGIRSATRILVRRQLDEETRKILEEIEGAAERAEACLKRLVVRP